MKKDKTIKPAVPDRYINALRICGIDVKDLQRENSELKYEIKKLKDEQIELYKKILTLI